MYPRLPIHWPPTFNFVALPLLPGSLLGAKRPSISYILFFISLSVLFCLLAGLGEFKLRDLNDEINKLLREKGHWEERILELGGPDYKVDIVLSLS